jgi:hypothetical protein
MVAGNQVLAAKWAAFLRTPSSGAFASLPGSAQDKNNASGSRLCKRINHLQCGDVVAKRLFRLAPQRLYIALWLIAKAQFGVGDHIRRGSLVSEVTFDIVGRSRLQATVSSDRAGLCKMSGLKIASRGAAKWVVTLSSPINAPPGFAKVMLL